jgi:hypothetical protein
MATSKTRADVKTELDEAEKHGLFVVTREALEEAVALRTVLLPHADLIYHEAELLRARLTGPPLNGAGA